MSLLPQLWSLSLVLPLSRTPVENIRTQALPLTLACWLEKRGLWKDSHGLHTYEGGMPEEPHWLTLQL